MKASRASFLLLVLSLLAVDASYSSFTAWTGTPFGTAINNPYSKNMLGRSRRQPAVRNASGGFFALRTTSALPTIAPPTTARRRDSISPLLYSASPEGHGVENKSIFIFGVGYVATAIALKFLRKGWAVHGTCTDPRKVKSLGEQGIKAYIFDDWSGPMMQPEPLEALASATCVLSTVPPALESGMDPVLVAHVAELQWANSKGSLEWVGYLSSTGVYGDRGGGWVTEADEPWPAVPRTKARLKAERSWLRLHERGGIPAHVFRLAGIYGPGRSALDAVARHSGDIRLAGADDGTMVSRTHVADIVSVLEASIEQPEPGMVVNVADDLPSTRYETLAYGCKLLGYPRQDPDPTEKFVNRRGGGNKRVDNSKMHALLSATGRSLLFPDYRIGLRALNEGDGQPFTEPASPAEKEKKPDTPIADAKEIVYVDSTTTGINFGSSDMLMKISSELGALSEKMSSLESSLGKLLAALNEKEMGAAAGVGGREISASSIEVSSGDLEGNNNVDDVKDIISSEESRTDEPSLGRGEAGDGAMFPDGAKQLTAVDPPDSAAGSVEADRHATA